MCDLNMGLRERADGLAGKLELWVESWLGGIVVLRLTGCDVLASHVGDIMNDSHFY